jgi:hypothetical protein
MVGLCSRRCPTKKDEQAIATVKQLHNQKKSFQWQWNTGMGMISDQHSNCSSHDRNSIVHAARNVHKRMPMLVSYRNAMNYSAM